MHVLVARLRTIVAPAQCLARYKLDTFVALIDLQDSSDAAAKALGESLYLEVFWITIRIAVIVTLATLVLSYPVAYFIATTSRLGAALGFALVILPSLSPFIFATLRIMFGVSWKVTLTAELFGGNAGLGYMINLARQEFDTATIFAAVIIIIAFVHGMDHYVLGPLQAKVSRHYAS